MNTLVHYIYYILDLFLRTIWLYWLKYIYIIFFCSINQFSCLCVANCSSFIICTQSGVRFTTLHKLILHALHLILLFKSDFRFCKNETLPRWAFTLIIKQICNEQYYMNLSINVYCKFQKTTHNIYYIEYCINNCRWHKPHNWSVSQSRKL